MGKLFKEFTEEKLNEIRTHPYYKPALEGIRKRAEKFLATDPPRIKFSQIHMFVTTGNRSVFQDVYSNYQTRMEDYFFLYLVDQDEKYLEPLADIIWNICDFESWSIPAHVGEHLDPERRRRNLDLCSTILAARVAEVIYYVGDKLPELVVKRAKYEVRYRLIESYAMYSEKDFWWMKSTNNWSSVCIGATLTAYLYAAEKEEIDAQLPRMIETARCYLRGFDDEGCCLEGYTYWGYGFSYFCLFASMLRDYTDGEIDLFKDPKVHEIALFQQNMAITNNKSISFSDCGNASFSPANWLSQYLKHEYPDMEIPSIPQTVGGSALRYFFWQYPEYAESEMKPKSKIFENAQWFISRRPRYTVACKAGHNNEPHNHNDVGSFVIAKNGKTTFTDPGAGEYTRQYFSSERYTLFACASRGHSVPLINGAEQVTSDVKSTVYEAELDKRYYFNMENAYRVPALISLKRDFNCDEEGFTVTDEYQFTEAPESVVERFVSYEQPKQTEAGRVVCGDSIMTYDPDVFEYELTSDIIIRGNGTGPTVWIVDLKVKKLEKSFKVSVRFE
ncbi:MAG: heparinase II/III family protein [Clostridia bacterium]|nr:heparinase II/III family protein [Clostridia bacterium]